MSFRGTLREGEPVRSAAVLRLGVPPARRLPRAGLLAQRRSGQPRRGAGAAGPAQRGRKAAARGDDRAHALQGAVAASLRGPVLLRRAEPAVRPLRGDHEVRRLLRGDAARRV